MSLYNLWLFACASLAVASGGLALFEVGVALAESGLDRPRKDARKANFRSVASHER